ncbi:hypothetical protein BH20VER1_BH20VER1_20080 [soil metagenome]
MSLAEIEVAIEALSPEERVKLYESLGRRLIPITEERRARWSEIMREMDAGKKISAAQFEAAHKNLESKGL